jgi:hypothetical protein
MLDGFFSGIKTGAFIPTRTKSPEGEIMKKDRMPCGCYLEENKEKE